jgi:hypothetical protein
MGNAEWTGVRLRDILSAAGVKAGSLEVSFQGLDTPPLPTVAKFAKSLSISHIMQDPDVLIAYRMNKEPLPLLNGFPARVVVPGWYSTYWVKNLAEINVLDHEFDGFWMRRAYLIPDTPCGCVEPGTSPAHMVPINRMDSLLAKGRPCRQAAAPRSGESPSTAGAASTLFWYPPIMERSGAALSSVLIWGSIRSASGPTSGIRRAPAAIT